MAVEPVDWDRITIPMWSEWRGKRQIVNALYSQDVSFLKARQLG